MATATITSKGQMTLHVQQLFGLLHREGEKAATLEEIEAGIAAGAPEGER